MDRKFTKAFDGVPTPYIKGGYELNGDDYIVVQFDQSTTLVVTQDHENAPFDTLVEIVEDGRRVAPSSRPDVLAAMYDGD